MKFLDFCQTLLRQMRGRKSAIIFFEISRISVPDEKHFQNFLTFFIILQVSLFSPVPLANPSYVREMGRHYLSSCRAFTKGDCFTSVETIVQLVLTAVLYVVYKQRSSCLDISVLLCFGNTHYCSVRHKYCVRSTGQYRAISTPSSNNFEYSIRSLNKC